MSFLITKINTNFCIKNDEIGLGFFSFLQGPVLLWMFAHLQKATLMTAPKEESTRCTSPSVRKLST